MSEVVQAPRDLLEAFGALHLPPRIDAHLQALMGRNTEGTLSHAEREQLEALVEWSEETALLRARALRVLGQRPA